MIYDIEKIEKAKAVLQSIANGKDPISGGAIEEGNFVNDPRLIRMFYFVAEVLDNVVKGNYSRGKVSEFIITGEQKNDVVFTEGNIGVNEIAKCINQQINPLMSKKVSGMAINNGLKRLGILSEAIDDLGKKRTTTNEKSVDYGFQLEKRNYNGVEYYMVVIDDKGKKYILDNIEEIMK
ncbi:MAG: hypothetical protein WBJ17_02690 [Natronincolaceae bacterium]|jgi:hypothetical protein|nr:hypothetical protein [Bacillota bacterium]NLK89977.1 hypothetical protein [Clostridiales bacterium]